MVWSLAGVRMEGPRYETSLSLNGVLAPAMAQRALRALTALRSRACHGTACTAFTHPLWHSVHGVHCVHAPAMARRPHRCSCKEVRPGHPPASPHPLDGGAGPRGEIAPISPTPRK